MPTPPAHLVLALSIAALAGCASTPIPATAPVPATTAMSAAPAAASRPDAMPRQAAETVLPNRSLAPHLDPASPVSTARAVYFDFDAYVVDSKYMTVVERQALYLAANPQLRVRIEGNTDERGSAEYNLALGQRRAEAVRQALRIAGASEAQMEAVSWGSEKPAATGNSELAWAQNRRADVQYPRP